MKRQGINVADEFTGFKEKCVAYTGHRIERYSPLLAGITYPDPSYSIKRMVSEVYVFEYVTDGCGYVRQDNHEFMVSKGDAYILHFGRHHEYHADSRNPWTKIWFNVTGELVGHLLSDYGLSDCIVIRGFNDGSCLEKILELIETDAVHSSDETAIWLHRYIQKLSAFTGARTGENTMAEEIKKYIEKNLTDSFSIQQVVEHMHVSRSRAMHVFKSAYGVSIYEYYQSRRFEVACTLLMNTGLSVSEIAEKIGYTDVYQFSSAFRKRYKISPVSLRKSTIGVGFDIT